jgi:predicted 2-oxoglutarate/Fe(II)-dependent dioxygenase YbiX
MEIFEEFNEKGYIVLHDILSKEQCDELVNHFFKLKDEGLLVNDAQCPTSLSVYGDPLFDNVLEHLTPFFSEAAGIPLYPTYSYARIYEKGETLAIHKDRPSCEISATMLLGYSGDNWNIMFSYDDEGKENVSTLALEPGSAALYKGTDINHWRDEFEGEWMCQVFFHYVNAEGPHKDHKFDKRPALGLTANTKECKPTNIVHRDEPVYFWQFPNVLSAEYCNNVIGMYGDSQLEDGLIGDNNVGGVDKAVRNVKKTLLPIHEGIGAHLIGSTFVANQQAWQFDINICHQIEYLRYDKTGRYLSHLDTFITKKPEIHRKLTALAFLNDNFEGGRFFLQVAEEKIYPIQTKGTIIVFPSFLLHGVEDVTSGVRHAVVCWLSGPSFR